MSVIILYVFELQLDPYFLLATGIPFSPSFAILGLMAVIFTISLAQTKRLFFSGALIPAVLLFGYLSISVLWALEPSRGVAQVVTLWSWFFTLVMVTSLLARCKLKDFSGLYWAHVIAVGGVGLFAVLTSGIGRRFTIVEGYNPTWYAAAAAVAIILGVELWPRSSARSRIVLFACLSWISLLLLLTQGRNSVLGLAASALGVTAYRFVIQGQWLRLRTWKNVLRKLPLVLVLLSLVFLLIFTLGLDQNLSRYQQLLSGDPSRATAKRTDIWQNFISIIGDSNVFGIGAASRNAFYEHYFGTRATPHNAYILTLLEGGLPGLLLWTSFQIGLIAIAIRSAKHGSYTLLWLSLFLCFLGFGNDTPYYKYYWMGVLMFFVLYVEMSGSLKAGGSTK